MERDFHHTAIYVLCRIAGMKSRYAEIVAYASQQVDDAIYGHALKFENGELFMQTCTSYRKLSPTLIDVNDAIAVWTPFHFLPRGQQRDGSQLITSPHSRPMDLLLEDVTEAGSELALSRLGIALHCYADAFAHQDFKGFYDQYNDIELVMGPDRGTILLNLKEKLINTILNLPPIGHVQAFKNPDIPYAVWSYRRDNGQIKTIHNLEERVLPALTNIYSYLKDYLSLNNEYKSIDPITNFANCRQKMLELFKYRANSEKRHQNWLEKIHSNHFNFRDFDIVDTRLDYQARSWFWEAVEPVKAKGSLNWIHHWFFNYYPFRKGSDFYQSHWVKFMRAAAEHQNRVVHHILPQCGIEVG